MRRSAYIPLALAGLLCALLACSRDDPERALRETVSTMQAAAEKRDASALLTHVSEQFVGESQDTGSMDRQAARQLLLAVFLRHPNINTGATVQSVAITGTRATAVINAVTTGGLTGLPNTARTWTFQTDWVRDGKAWKLSRARWE
jgi:hypothetical protein